MGGAPRTANEMRKSHHFRLYGALAHDRSTLAWSPQRALVSAPRTALHAAARLGSGLPSSARPGLPREAAACPQTALRRPVGQRSRIFRVEGLAYRND